MPNPTPVTEKPSLFHSDSTLIDVQTRRRRPPALNLSDGNSSRTLERPFVLSQDEKHRTSPTTDASVEVAEEAETDQEIESEDDEVEEEKKVDVELKAHKKQEEISHFTPLRLFCYHFFYKVSTKRALWFMYFSMFCVIVSVVLVCLQSLNAFSLDTGGASSRAVYHKVWLPIEIVLTIIFTIEYLGSLYGSPNRFKFCKKWLNILDLISILPFYMNFIFPSENGRNSNPSGV
ncbi:hypothetical protein BKA69DRAFT_8899 [Paraphysoderma sedebokerense]|nr:hypothetical protein BKA69DRAFT_8899 [Paraphysoderma sedebokerense]